MRTKLLLTILFLSAVIIGSRAEERDDYLRKVVGNLEKIETATYRLLITSWEPGDTIGRSCSEFVEEYDNPADTMVGASFVRYEVDEAKTIRSCYDGHVSVSFYHDKQGALVDDFTSRKLPFRPLGVGSPFFNYAKNIIKYVLTSQDSLSVEMKDAGDEYLLSLVIYEDEQVEFLGKPYRIPKNPYCFDPISRYEMHIRKSDDLPYKVKREMSHNTSEYICSEMRFNCLDNTEGIIATSYIPTDYEIREYGKKYGTKPAVDLKGQKAPDWTLTDIKGEQISLSELKSKVIVLEFTGIGCGPCRVSIPFLNDLKKRYDAEQLTVLAVEIWNRKLPSLRNYANRHQIDYLFLAGNDEMVNKYQTGLAVPAFYILDENRIVRQIIKGYNPDKGGKEIIRSVDELLGNK